MSARERAELAWAPGSSSSGCELIVAGAHGGAGATTLALLLLTALDAGVIRRAPRDGPRVNTGGRPMVLVSRNTTAASARATAAVNVLASHGIHVAVLVIVSDGLPDTSAAAYRFRVLAARVGAVVRFPFVAALRAADDPAEPDLPRKARKALADITTAAVAATGDSAAATATRRWE